MVDGAPADGKYPRVRKVTQADNPREYPLVIEIAHLPIGVAIDRC